MSSLILSLAVRNTLRYRRRSMLTALTVMMGTALLTIGISWVTGVLGSFFQTGTQALGHVRVVTARYAEREQLQPLYENIPDTGPVVERLEALPGVVHAYPRIQMGVAASRGGEEIGETFGLVVGAPPGYFSEVLGLRDRVAEGRYFSDDPAEAAEEALIGVTLARQMEIGPGDEAIFLGQTQDGSISPVKVRVAGLIDSGNGLFDRQAYVDLEKARWMADIPDGALEILVFGEDWGEAEALAEVISPAIAELGEAAGLTEGRLIAEPWSHRDPWSGMLAIVSTVIGMMIGIIVFITALGVLNTMLMSVLERTAEIGVLRAMGLGVGGVVLLFVVESLAISTVGGALGAVIGTVPSLLLETHGLDLGAVASSLPATLPVNRVLHADWTPIIALQSFGLGILMAFIGAASPALRAAGIQPVSAMRARS